MKTVFLDTFESFQSSIGVGIMRKTKLECVLISALCPYQIKYVQERILKSLILTQLIYFKKLQIHARRPVKLKMIFRV